MVCGAMAYDCEHLQEPERTACLDKAADENVGMFPVPDHMYKATSSSAAALDPYSEAGENTDDIMGDLGESVTNTATMSTSAKAQQELKLAEATSQGMFNDDIKVARAFSDLTDEMDDLRSHMGQLHTQQLITDTEKEANKAFDSEHGKVEEHDLGESDSLSTPVEVESLGVLDASFDDITKDLTPQLVHKSPAAVDDQTVEDLLKSMGSTMAAHKQALDISPDFEETAAPVV